MRHMPNLEVLSLSVNNISSLRDFAGCTSLRELYLRRNKIRSLDQIRYLADLPELRILWLGDNECAEDPNYRLTVLSVLPNLTKLDDHEVTPEERDEALGLQSRDSGRSRQRDREGDWPAGPVPPATAERERREREAGKATECLSPYTFVATPRSTRKNSGGAGEGEQRQQHQQQMHHEAVGRSPVPRLSLDRVLLDEGVGAAAGKPTEGNVEAPAAVGGGRPASGNKPAVHSPAQRTSPGMPSYLQSPASREPPSSSTSSTGEGASRRPGTPPGIVPSRHSQQPPSRLAPPRAQTQQASHPQQYWQSSGEAQQHRPQSHRDFDLYIPPPTPSNTSVLRAIMMLLPELDKDSLIALQTEISRRICHPDMS